MAPALYPSLRRRGPCPLVDARGAARYRSRQALGNCQEAASALDDAADGGGSSSGDTTTSTGSGGPAHPGACSELQSICSGCADPAIGAGCQGYVDAGDDDICYTLHDTFSSSCAAGARQ